MIARHAFLQNLRRELATAIPGARLVWLEGVGHEFPPQAVWNRLVAEIVRAAA